MKRLARHIWPLLRNIARGSETEDKAYSGFVTMIAERNVADYGVKQQYDMIRVFLKEKSEVASEQIYLFAKRYLHNRKNAKEQIWQNVYLWLGLVGGALATSVYEALVERFDIHAGIHILAGLGILTIFAVLIRSIYSIQKYLYTLPFNVHQIVIEQALSDFCNEYESFLRESWDNKDK